jgi:RNA polymerase sigma-70 factor (ECF subfamily)
VLPNNPLEPCRRGRRTAHARGPRGSGRALQRLLVSDLCPIRRKGHGADKVPDLTHDYFARLLEKGTFVAADPEKGRFRAFLLEDCNFFLSDRRDRDRALKRGGGRHVLSIDARDAGGQFLREPSHDKTPDWLFGRDWAKAVIDRVFDSLEQHYSQTVRSQLFRQLKPLVSSHADAVSRSSVAEEAGMTEGNVRVAIHRLRARFAAGLCADVAATLQDSGEEAVEEELRALFALLES